ncbi:amidohydrolase [Alkaliphilus metalliredigens QYMF]|uniref:Amidohydrolase n=1 Tax=Alkaliphilus metalliredigens (strain QYMF) TaxID=293826 RepID=A6TPD0_ALKMQ|nr:amidohydrolase family protein [Alkaliphilus metalliredigens]ABR48048.1 amidohydrolase [Alkaliphilus metalliredigens QYMF]
MTTTILKNAYLIDPTQEVKGWKDLEIIDGKVVKVCENINTINADKVYDLKGKLCVPGIIDTHVHLTLDGSNRGYYMLAKAGVTTALDMYGPPEKIYEHIHQYGTGINIACLAAQPQNTDNATHCDYDQHSIRKFIHSEMKRGALGIKLIGGHYPMSPELTKKFIQIANEEKAYIAFHVGTTNKGSNIEGFKEAIFLAEGNSFHVAHVNSYCRGQIQESIQEVQSAIELLSSNPHLVSESYLSRYNGTSGRCEKMIPISEVTSKCLIQNGFANTESGVENAIVAGIALVVANVGEINAFIENSEEALQYYRNKKGRVNLSFPINKIEAGLLLATAKNKAGDFIIPAISSDGGEIPRNVIIEKGIQMVKYGALTHEEFVLKTSVNPAKMLGLKNKGTLGIGFDADITVIDTAKEEPVMSMVMGEIIMHEGLVIGKKGRIITTDEGSDYVKMQNIDPYIVNIEDTLLYQRRNNK